MAGEVALFKLVYEYWPGSARPSRRALTGRPLAAAASTVVQRFEEAGDELFTFLRFRHAQWKTLRTMDALEQISEEFRRRTKTQASLPSQDPVLILLFGLLRAGPIRVRKIDWWQEMSQVAATWRLEQRVIQARVAPQRRPLAGGSAART